MEEDTPPPSSPPPVPLFKMPRVHKQEYWSFVRLVAPSTEMPPGQTAWKTTEAELAYCLKCKTTFKYRSGSSASIRKHMNHEHPHEIGSVGREAAVKRVENALASKRKSSAVIFSPTKRTKKINPAEEEMATRALIEWIAKCLRPLSIVEDEELRFVIALVQTMHGIYELPSCRTITERMQAHAQQLRSLLKEKIAEEVDFYSLTTDMWTSRTTDSYIALTIHFMTDFFELRSYTLEVASFCGKHTGARIRKKLRDLMYTWGLDISRVSKVVRDNGANIVKACHELGVDHFGCMAHSLHLVVSGALAKTKAEVMDESNGDVDEQEGGAVDELAEVDDGEEHWVEDLSMELEAIAFLENELVGLETYVAANSVRQEALGVEMLDVADDSLDEGLLNGCMSANAAKTILKAMKQAMCESRKDISSFRKMVTYFNKSSKGKGKLKSLQNLAIPLTVIKDVATRWNSTHHMIRRLLQLRPAIQDFFAYMQTSKGKEDFSDAKLARPTSEMWFHLQCLDKLLVHFELVTKTLSGDTYPTITLAFPCIRLLEKRLMSRNIFC
ncbi:hypothetical protein GN244_ATG16664 [Phytophthora infestans]|uniref:BED-type domain-containing protein n=1 Tax=Phytophthora infestans TaxID=4787 RepID=A0A833T083_PHYIN|nr:hypothetical protein GN244_ATG16664 [Phytophthora infestans]KAF4131047.1 hypothetical protein GN958_ATG19754 [Phytophthora infestans]